MTHSNIYTKFMIEYDKANITSSYPSLTRYEVATILDKAYLALIAQKLTGNNPRKTGFEGDVKALEDLRPLITTSTLNSSSNPIISNGYDYATPDDFLYYVIAMLESNKDNAAIDNQSHIKQNVHLISHDKAQSYIATSNNLPWLEDAVCYMQGNTITVLVDAYDIKKNPGTLSLNLTYIKNPSKFATGPGTSAKDYDFGSTEFELSDTMAEEMINLAVIMSTRIVESSRLQSELNTRPLES